MALLATWSLNVPSITPPQAAQATLVLTNTGAVALSVTNVDLQVTAQGSLARSVAVPSSVVPIGPGVTTLVPANGTLSIGPFPIVAPLLSSGGTFYQLGSPPPNIQGAMPLQEQFSIGGLVYASDGSVNSIAAAGLLVSYIPPPPVGTMGGFLQYAAQSNSVALGVGGAGAWP